MMDHEAWSSGPFRCAVAVRYDTGESCVLREVWPEVEIVVSTSERGSGSVGEERVSESDVRGGKELETRYLSARAEEEARKKRSRGCGVT